MPKLPLSSQTTMTRIIWHQFLVIGHTPTWDKGRQKEEPMCLKRKRDGTALLWCRMCPGGWMYRGSSSVPGTPQQQVVGTVPLMDPALLGCPGTLGKFKAHTAHFVWKEQITDPKAESLFFSPSVISFFSSPAVSSDSVLLFLLLQTSVLCLDHCSEQLKYIYPTLRTACFDSSQWDTKAEINT